MPQQTDERFQQLENFVNFYCDALHHTKAELSPRTGDASSRRYFDVVPFQQYLAVDSPSGNCTTEFIRTASLFKRLNVAAPAVHCADVQNGYMLIDNIQPSVLFYEAIHENVNQTEWLLSGAMDLLHKIQQCKTKPDWVHDYDEILIRRELNLFSDWFIGKLLQLPINRHLRTQFDIAFDGLIDNFKQQPQVLVHRDYHCRNLLVSETDNSLTIIDFQDAVWGPVTYDLVSLLRDCYILYPNALVNQCLTEFNTTCHPHWQQWFDLTGLQRNLKVLGIFARLSIRDNKHQYLGYLRHVLDMALNVTRQYEMLTSLDDYLTNQVLPIAQNQTWYHQRANPFPLLDLSQ